VPDLLTAEPWWGVGEVSAAGDDERAVGDGGERSGDAERDGDGRESLPCGGGGRGFGVGGGGEERACERGESDGRDAERHEWRLVDQGAT
jgi:hypothetical protein